MRQVLNSILPLNPKDQMQNTTYPQVKLFHWDVPRGVTSTGSSMEQTCCFAGMPSKGTPLQTSLSLFCHRGSQDGMPLSGQRAQPHSKGRAGNLVVIPSPAPTMGAQDILGISPCGMWLYTNQS